MKYFSYNPAVDGFESYATKEEAIKACNEIIDYFRDEANEGWSDDVANTCWGIISQRATQIDLRQATEEDPTSCDDWCDYELQDVSEKDG